MMGNFPLYNIQEVTEDFKKVLIQMSEAGFLIQKEVLKKLEDKLSKEIEIIRAKIYKIAGFEFNLNSSQQVSEFLFEKLKLPVSRKNINGYSTDEKVLNKIKQLHRVVPLILAYRELFKIFSTYIGSLEKEIKEDGRIHSQFLTDVAVTGRIVSRNPNLQNIPIRSKLGREIRKAFIVPEGKILLAADYSQIDLRVLAHFSKDEKLIKAFRKALDIHLATAKEIFNKKTSEITDNDRRVAKTVNFGITYGITAHGLSDNLNISNKEAQKLIDTYFLEYPKVKEYLYLSIIKALKNGYVETLGGIRKEIRELKSDVFYIKKAGERMALNYPIQGTAAEIIEMAMVKISKLVEKEKLKSRMILQIHDELLFEVCKEELTKMITVVKSQMESVVSLDVPLIVNFEKGLNWGEMEKIRIKDYLRNENE